MKILASITVAALLSASAANAITYYGTMTAGSTTAYYSVATDGTLGALTSANLLSSSGTVNSSGGSTSFSNGNFNNADGVGLFATATQLWYDFSGDGAATIGNYSTGYTGICLASGIYSCASATSPAIFVARYYDGPGSDFEMTNAYSARILVGATVPEPASWALLIAGFGMTGAVLRGRRRVTA